MDSSKEIEIEARLARLEESIAHIQHAVDSLVERAAGPAPRGFARESGDQRRDPAPGQAYSAPSSGFADSWRRGTAADDIAAQVSSWFSSRSPEWWVTRVGIGLMIGAILILYGYSIARVANISRRS